VLQRALAQLKLFARQPWPHIPLSRVVKVQRHLTPGLVRVILARLGFWVVDKVLGESLMRNRYSTAGII